MRVKYTHCANCVYIMGIIKANAKSKLCHYRVVKAKRSRCRTEKYLSGSGFYS